jgi:hypothetical protein
MIKEQDMAKLLKILVASVLVGLLLTAGGCGSGGAAAPINVVSPQITTSIDGVGTVGLAATLSAASGSFNFTDNATLDNNVIIQGFGADDKITIIGATSAQYDTSIQSTGAGDVIIAYNSGTALNRIEIQGVVPSGFVFDVASFNALGVGKLEFQ